MSWTISRTMGTVYASLLSLPVREEVSWAASCADSAPSALSKSTPTVALFCAKDKTREYSRLFPSGMTCGRLTDGNGADLSTSLVADFRAQIYPRPTQKVKVLTEKIAAYGRKCGVSLAKFDRDSHSWRTPQTSLIKGVSESLQTLPPWGMTAGGVLSALPTPERLTCVRGGGALPWLTPKATDTGKGEGQETFLKRMGDRTDKCHQSLPAQVRAREVWRTPTANDAVDRKFAVNCRGEPLLSGQVKMWPTPVARDASRTQHGKIQGSPSLGAGNGGPLNPDWVAWLMGWPIGWTNLKPLGMDRFRRFLNCFGTLSREGNDETNSNQ